MKNTKDVIFNEFTIEDYLHGRCHIFAYVLTQLFDYTVSCVWDTDDETEELILVHAYCKDENGLFLDARGFLDSKEILMNPFDFAFPHEMDYGAEDLEMLMLTGFLESPDEEELTSLKKYVLSHTKEYVK